MTATKSKQNSDSLAVATDFIHNAKAIQQDLIKLDFAIKREVVYKQLITEQDATNQRQAAALATSQQATAKATAALATTNLALAEQRLKTKAAKLEIWAMRIAAALYLAGKIQGLLP